MIKSTRPHGNTAGKHVYAIGTHVSTELRGTSSRVRRAHQRIGTHGNIAGKQVNAIGTHVNTEAHGTNSKESYGNTADINARNSQAQS